MLRWVELWLLLGYEADERLLSTWSRKELTEIMKTMQIYIHANAKCYKLTRIPCAT